MFRDRLATLATFTRRGQVPKGESRHVEAFVDGRRLSPPQDVLWLPRGLWAEARRLGIPITDRRRLLPSVDFGWRGNLRAYQYEAVRSIARYQGGLLISPPGSGKTTMGFAALAVWKQPATWLVHTKDLARQARERAAQLFNLPPAAIGYVGEGQPFDPGSHLTVAMVQSLVRRRDWCERLARRSGAVVLDEHAHAPANTFRTVLSRFDACYRLGLGATLSRSDGLGDMAKVVLGPAMVRVPIELLVRQGWVLRPTVVLVPARFAYSGNGQWADVQRSRAADLGRNLQLVAWVTREVLAGHRCLVLVELVPHAKVLAYLLRQRGVPATHLTGEVPSAVRQRLYGELERDAKVLVATRLADEGLDLPCLDRLFAAVPGRSEGRIEQQAGRVMRPYPAKKDAVFFDFMDPEPSSLAEQAAFRQEVYGELGFPARRVAVA